MTLPTALAPVHREPDPTAPKYVRKVKGWKYQARIWIGVAAGGTVNLGLYPSESAAAQAVRATVRRLTGRLTPLTVWRAAVAIGLTPPGLMPQHVRRRPDGTFAYVVRKPPGPRRVVGRFATLEAAHAAAVAALPPFARADLRAKS